MDERAPALIRYGLPLLGGLAFFVLTISAAFTATAEWASALPVGFGIAAVTTVIVVVAVRRTGRGVLRRIDDYWHAIDDEEVDA